MEKVIIVYRNIQNQISEERIWVERKRNHYVIRNIPFFAPNLALYDVINVEKDDNELYFDGLIEASGHSTIQIVVLIETDKKRIIEKIESFGCHWEGMNDQKYLSVDISPQLDYSVIKAFLETEVNKSVLDYKEACLSENHNLLG